MANFNIAYQLVAKAEGGYQSSPEDSGNYNSLGELVGTNWGISAPTYEGWIGRAPTKKDMLNMSKSTAEEIYHKKFWAAIRGDQINDQDVANIFFDGVVNHGRTGVKIMQSVLNVPQDGIVGPGTIGQLNAQPPAKVYVQYREARKAFYYDLVNRKRSLGIFLQGWLNRISRFQAYTSYSAPIGGIIALIGIYFLITKK